MYILFDIGGTSSRIAVSFDGDRIEQPLVMHTPANFEEGIQVMKNAVTQLAQGEKIQGIAGGIAGPMDKGKSRLVNAPNLPGWINKPLKVALEQSLGGSVFLENDAAIAGLGEGHFGSQKHADVLAYLTISTGVGGARIVDGNVDRAERGFEPGHQIVDPKGPECVGCRKQGHLEAFIGGASLERRYGKKPEEIDDDSIWREVEYWLAIGLNNTIVHWSPDAVVLGGSMMAKIDLQRVAEQLALVCTIYTELPVIVRSTLQYNGLYGALALLKLQKIIS